jgi:hypothetical protein
MMRFLNPALLRADWPQIRGALDPRLRRCCERRLALAGPAAPAGTDQVTVSGRAGAGR